MDVIDVPPEKADELARRLSASTAAKAMADADDRGVRFTAAEKVAVLVVLSNWIYEFGIDALGGKLADLRTELMRDPRIPPFQQMGFRYALGWADGDNTGDAGYPHGGIQVGEQIRINGNQLVRVRAVIPVELAAEFVDSALYSTLEIEPV